MNYLTSDCDRLLERHRPYLMLLARARILTVNGRKLDASDIVQQTLMDAFAKREQFRSSNDAKLAAWLPEILKHNLLDGLRNAQRDKRDVRREQAMGATNDESLSRADAWLAAVQTSPSQRVSKQEDLLRLSEALEALPIAQREAIVLHHLQGLKLAEVAVELGRSESAIAGLLFRDLNKLHQLLSK